MRRIAEQNGVEEAPLRKTAIGYLEIFTDQTEPGEFKTLVGKLVKPR